MKMVAVGLIIGVAAELCHQPAAAERAVGHDSDRPHDVRGRCARSEGRSRSDTSRRARQCPFWSTV